MVRVQKYSYMIVDIAIIIASLVIAILLRLDFQVPPNFGEYILTNSSIYILTTLIFSVLFGCYGSIFVYFGFSELFKQFFVSTLTGAFILSFYYLGMITISGSITVIYCGVFFIISSGIRGSWRFNKWVKRTNDLRQGKAKRVLIIGAGDAGVLVAKHLIDNKRLGLFPVGILDDNVNKHNKEVAGIKILGDIDHTSFYAKKLCAEEIVLAIPSATNEQMKIIYEKVSNANMPTKIFQCVISSDSCKINGTPIKEITIEDLLFRDSVETDHAIHREFIENKTIIVTGGAGSIGSELCKQILHGHCKKLIIFDFNENALFELNEELKYEYKGKYVVALGSVRDKMRIKKIFEEHSPDIVFHAAAHKHVPLVESNPFEAIKNNVMGTINVLEQSVAVKCKKFILISSDKAVNPTNVMGATKRIAELLVKLYSNQDTEMVAVRFGNVLNSAGSVVPLFQKQIESGGPVTVTHEDMTRYFMTIEEAVSLVLLAGASAKNSELFVLDMGKPVKIYDLAINLIRLYGYKPFVDIDIKITGLRPGEKLFEELRLDDESMDKTSHKKIFIMEDNGIDKEQIRSDIRKLIEVAEEQKDLEQLHDILFDLAKAKIKLGSVVNE